MSPETLFEHLQSDLGYNQKMFPDYAGKGPLSKVYQDAKDLLSVWVKRPKLRQEIEAAVNQSRPRWKFNSKTFDAETCLIVKGWLK